MIKTSKGSEIIQISKDLIKFLCICKRVPIKTVFFLLFKKKHDIKALKYVFGYYIY